MRRSERRKKERPGLASERARAACEPSTGLLFSLTALVALSACAGTVPRALGWDAAAPAKEAFARVAVGNVANRRPRDRGGTNSSLVGYWRTPFGQRSFFRTDDDVSPLLYSVRGLVRDALRTAGVDVTSPEDPSATALVNVEIRELWTDSEEPPDGTVALDLILLDPATHAERARVPVEGTGRIGSREAGSSPECHGGALTTAHCAYFVVPMDEAYRSIVEEFHRPEIRSAALGQSVR
jgi:hypothetical protein